MSAINTTVLTPAYDLACRASFDAEKPDLIAINAVRLLAKELSDKVQLAIINDNPRGLLLYTHINNQPDSSTTCNFIPCHKMDYPSFIKAIDVQNPEPLFYQSKCYGVLAAKGKAESYAEQLALRIGHAFKLQSVQLEKESLLRRVENSDSTLSSMRTWFERKITDLANAEKSLDKRLQYEKALTKCSRTLLSDNLDDESLKQALEYLRKASGAERVLLMKNSYNSDNELATGLVCSVSSIRLPEIPEAEFKKQWLYSESFPAWSQLLSQDEIITGNIEEVSKATKKIIEALEINSYCLLPISALGQWQGFLAFGSKDENSNWLNDDIDILRTGAEMFGTWYGRDRMAYNLRNSEETARVLLNAPLFAACLIDAHGVVISNNEIAEGMLKTEKDELIGRKLVQFVPSELRQEIQSIISECKDCGTSINTNYEFKNRCYNITICPVFDTKYKAVEKLALYAKDCTKDREMEQQLRQAQKLESIGQLSAGIAHEINTPMQYLANYIDFLQPAFDKIISGKTSPQLLADIPDALLQAKDGIARVTDIVKSMKEFSHPGTGEMIAVDLNRAIASTITIARNEWKYVAKVETDFDENLPLVHCLPNEINQVILNLICNAAQAIAQTQGNEKGFIGITTTHENGLAEIRVVDTGSGIPTEIQSKIFDPFFTTKDIGSGTGQGLSICHSVITKHNGEITFETEPGRGTTFTITLPIDRN